MHIEVKCISGRNEIILPIECLILEIDEDSSSIDHYYISYQMRTYEISKDEYNRIKDILRVLSGEYLKELIGRVDEKVRKDFREHIGVTFGLEV